MGTRPSVHSPMLATTRQAGVMRWAARSGAPARIEGLGKRREPREHVCLGGGALIIHNLVHQRASTEQQALGVILRRMFAAW